MNRFSFALACPLLGLLAFSATPMSAQTSGINPYYRIDASLGSIHARLPVTANPQTFTNHEKSACERVEVSVNPDSADLPDAPAPKFENLNALPLSSNSNFQRRDSPPMGYGAYRYSNAPYLTLTAAVYGSNVAAIELLQGCLRNNRCLTIPASMRGRPAMYVTGLGVASGVSYLGYYLRKKEVRWWFVPAVLATTFDLVFVVGAARRQ
jgi:hypothetical protein